MAWQKAREHVDEAEGVHVIVLRNEQSLPPAEHQVIIHIGHDACPTCGHAVAKDKVGEIDPKAHVDAVLTELNRAHEAIRAYRTKHRVPGRQA